MPRCSSLRRQLLVFTLMVAGLSGGGCGKKEASAEGAAAPLEGRDVSRAGQLTGTWMRVSAGDYLGFEFGREGQALVTHRVHGLQGETLTLQYSVLDGGRLSLVSPGGRTQIFAAVVAGDALELTPESGGRTGASQRFRKVKDGQTLAVALREHMAGLEAERTRRAEALRKFLRSDDLVARRAQDNGTPLVIAIKFEQTEPNLGGTGIIDPDPSRHDPLRPMQEVSFEGEIQPADALSPTVKIVLNLQPLGRDPSAQGALEFEVSGDLERPTLRGRSRLSQAGQGDVELVMVRDSGQRRRTETRLTEQREAVRRAIAAVSDPLGGRVVLTGTRTAPGRAAEPLELLLERVGESTTFQGQAKIGGRETPIAGLVDTVLGAGAIYLNQPTGEQWRLQRADAQAPYRGPVRPNPRTDFLGHGEVELTLGRVWSVAEVKAEREAMERYVNQDLRTPTALVGFVERGRSGEVEHWPVWMELQTSDGDTARGQIWLLGQNVGVEATGRRSGRSFQLNATQTLPGSANTRSLTNQRWQITLTSMDPDPRFEGTMSSNLGGGGSVALVPLTPNMAARMKESLLSAVRAPALRVTNLTISRNTEPSHFRFPKASASQPFTGEAVGADLTGSRPSAFPPGLIDAELGESRGIPVLRLRAEGSPEPVRGRGGRVFEYTLAANVLAEEPRLTGWDAPSTGNQTWLNLTPEPPEAVFHVNEEQALRLAAHRAGAMLEPPNSPAAGQEVLLLIHATDRDARLGHIHFADDRYSHGNSIPRAALHAGLLKPGETAVVRLTYDTPHTAPTESVERNGIASTTGTFRPNNTVPTFRIERVEMP